VWVFGDLVEIKLDGEQTGGAYSLLEDWPGPGYAPALHVHERADEVVHILGGRFRLLDRDGERELAPGDTVRIPMGTAHAFANAGDEQGHRLVMFCPAGPELLWAEIGVPAADRTTPPAARPDMRRFAEAARRHGLTIVRPG